MKEKNKQGKEKRESEKEIKKEKEGRKGDGRNSGSRRGTGGERIEKAGCTQHPVLHPWQSPEAVPSLRATQVQCDVSPSKVCLPFTKYTESVKKRPSMPLHHTHRQLSHRRRSFGIEAVWPPRRSTNYPVSWLGVSGGKWCLIWPIPSWWCWWARLSGKSGYGLGLIPCAPSLKTKQRTQKLVLEVLKQASNVLQLSRLQTMRYHHTSSRMGTI